MDKKDIDKTKYYLMSGRVDSDEVHSIVTGHYAFGNYVYVIEEYTPKGRGQFMINDGQYHDYSNPSSLPIIDEAQALSWLDDNLSGKIMEITNN